MISACSHVRSRSLAPEVEVGRRNLCLKRGSSFGWVVQSGGEERAWMTDARCAGESEVEKSCFAKGAESSGSGAEGQGGHGASRLRI